MNLVCAVCRPVGHKRRYIRPVGFVQQNGGFTTITDREMGGGACRSIICTFPDSPLPIPGGGGVMTREELQNPAGTVDGVSGS